MYWTALRRFLETLQGLAGSPPLAITEQAMFRQRSYQAPVPKVRSASSTGTCAQIAVDTEITPTGKFRVGMNANNATLVIRGADGTVSGLSADLGGFSAGKLGVPYG